MRWSTRRALTRAFPAAVLIACIAGVHVLLGRDDDFLSLLGSSVLGGWLCSMLILLTRWRPRRRHRRTADYDWVDRLFAVGFLVLIAALAIYDSPIFWVTLAFLVAALLYAEWERRVLPRRIARPADE